MEAETFTVQIKRSESILIVDINTEVRSDCLANNQTACQELSPSELLPPRFSLVVRADRPRYRGCIQDFELTKLNLFCVKFVY